MEDMMITLQDEYERIYGVIPDSLDVYNYVMESGDADIMWFRAYLISIGKA